MHFVFGTEVVLDLETRVSAEVYASCNVLDQNWLVCLDDLTLHLETAGWVDVLDNPETIGALPGSGEVSDLFLGEWCAHV